MIYLKRKAMNLKNLILISILLVLTSCNSLKHGISIATIDDDKIVFHSKSSFIDSNRVTKVECDEFVSNALSKYNIAIITKVFFFLECTKEPVINMHDSLFVDTVYTFSNSNNKIQIYRARQKDFIIFFDVTESKYSLTGNVKTGITKDLFIRKFQIAESISNVVQVINSDSSMKFIFYFENNRLKRIKSDFYLD